ncbi:CoA transferase [Nocardioides sp. BGMRC 2183]|nr:CoA transferase [Nocardioides sp. BGMRC 2183]
MSRAPLHGVRVLDLSRMLPVGVLSQLLADLGATVIKVDRPGVGEESRAFGAPVAGTSATHAFLDRGKKSVAIDLKDPAGIAVVQALVADADVVLESFRPGVAERLGVGYEELSALNPRLVYCSVNGYGIGGPRDQEPGHDLNYLSYAGAMSFGGTKTHGPSLGGIQVADLLGGLSGGIGLLAALVAARADGRGRKVEVALADAALWGLGLHLSSWLAGGAAAGPESTAVTGAGPSYRIYRCADGRYLSIAAVERRFWVNFVQAVGRPDLEDRQHDPLAIGEVADLIASCDLTHWVEVLDERETCATPVMEFAEVAADEQFAAREMFVAVPGQDEVLQVGNPIKLTPPLEAPTPASAAVGGDTQEILAGLDLPPDIVRTALGWATPEATDRGAESR